VPTPLWSRRLEAERSEDTWSVHIVPVTRESIAPAERHSPTPVRRRSEPLHQKLYGNRCVSSGPVDTSHHAVPRTADLPSVGLRVVPPPASPVATRDGSVAGLDVGRLRRDHPLWRAAASPRRDEDGAAALESS